MGKKVVIHTCPRLFVRNQTQMLKFEFGTLFSLSSPIIHTLYALPKDWTITSKKLRQNLVESSFSVFNYIYEPVDVYLVGRVIFVTSLTCFIGWINKIWKTNVRYSSLFDIYFKLLDFFWASKIFRTKYSLNVTYLFLRSGCYINQKLNLLNKEN